MTKYKQGYSLIELTIVVGLVSILAITISAIVLSTIVSSNRIKTQVRIRQTGDFALGQIGTLIRNSKRIVSCDSSASLITIQNQDNNLTQLMLSGDRIASNSAYLTPEDLQVDSYIMSCAPSDADPKIINLTFSLTTTNAAEGKQTENPTEIFTTSIELRNQ